MQKPTRQRIDKVQVYTEVYTTTVNLYPDAPQDRFDGDMRNIVLIGFMGTGKSASAKALAKEMGKIYISSDCEIEKREKKSITDIFRDKGEPYFRKIEKECIKDIMKKTDCIIDAGGGVVLDSENMDVLKKYGIVICLWASAEVIYARTKGTNERPLLNVDDPLKRIQELLDCRRPFYKKAEFQIDTTRLSIPEVVDRIKKIVYTYERTK